MARRPLGRGLSALLGDESGAAAAASPTEATMEIDIDLIDPNPEQPRTRFVERSEEHTSELQSH